MGLDLPCGWQAHKAVPGLVLTHSRPGGQGSRHVHAPPARMGVGVPLISCPTLPPPAAQEARNKFEEAERSLRDMEESIRYGTTGLATAGQHHHLPHSRLLPRSPEEVVMGIC